MSLIIPTKNIQFHLRDRKGTFTLVSYNNDIVRYKTIHSSVSQVNFYKVKCLHGRSFFNDPQVKAFSLAISLRSKKSTEVWYSYMDYIALGRIIETYNCNMVKVLY